MKNIRCTCIHCTSSQKYTCTCTCTFIVSPFFSDILLDYAFMYSTCARQKAQLFHFNAVRQQIHSYLLSHPPPHTHSHPLTPSLSLHVSVTYRAVFLSCGLSWTFSCQLSSSQWPHLSSGSMHHLPLLGRRSEMDCDLHTCTCSTYHIVGKFGGGFNVANWQFRVNRQIKRTPIRASTGARRRVMPVPPN